MHISVSSLSLKKYLKGKVKKRKDSVSKKAQYVVLMTTLLTSICSKLTSYLVYFRTRTEKGQTGIITEGLDF